jgi:hypothetical protein
MKEPEGRGPWTTIALENEIIHAIASVSEDGLQKMSGSSLYAVVHAWKQGHNFQQFLQNVISLCHLFTVMSYIHASREWYERQYYA